MNPFDEQALALAWLRVKAERGKHHAQVLSDYIEKLVDEIESIGHRADRLEQKIGALEMRNNQLTDDRTRLQQMASDLNEELRTLRQNYTVTNTFEVLRD